MLKIPYGISDYKKLKENDYYYVDKTMYLEKLEEVGSVLTYLRPGRYGKTLFTSMLSYYYDVSAKNEFKTLFKNTYVEKNPTKNKNNYYVLKFDFAILYNKDVIGVIEYDGKQHFEPIDFFGGVDGFRKTQTRDEIKNNYCKEHNVPILRIPYTMSIEEIKNVIYEYYLSLTTAGCA